MHTYAHDLADKSPILAVISPTKRCGKTTLLTLLQHLCAKAELASNLTPAVLYRLIDAEKPTLLIDEADTFLFGKDDLRGVLNSGFTRNAAVIIRVVNGHLTRFKTWAPKAIACIDKLPDTLQDRAIEIFLQRKSAAETVESLSDADPCVFNTLASKALKWVETNAATLKAARPTIPNQIEDDRARDKWRTLLAIADIAGGHWPVTARTAAAALSCTKSQDNSKIGMLLADLQDMFAKDNTQQLTTKEILRRLAKIDDRPWSRFKHGRQLEDYELARLLARFQVKPRTLRFGKRTAKGYTAADLAPVFARYAAKGETPSQQA